MIRRLSVAVAAVVLTGTVASGCSTFTNNTQAAKAGGASLSVAEFEDILADYTESRSAGATTTTGDATDTTLAATTTSEDPTVPGTEARSLLTEWVTSHLLLAALEKAGVPVDDAARTAATTSLQAQIGDGWAKLDTITQDFLVNDQAALDAFAASPLIPDAQVQQAYAAGVAASNVLCLRVMLFGDEDKANAAYQQVQAGGDFATIADANSTDPTAGAGGIYTNADTQSECTSADSLNAVVAQSVASLPIGQASPPQALTSSDGTSQYVIFLQRPWDEVADAATPIIRKALAAGAQRAILANSSAHIDSRYGTWDPTTQSVVPTR